MASQWGRSTTSDHIIVAAIPIARRLSEAVDTAMSFAGFVFVIVILAMLFADRTGAIGWRDRALHAADLAREVHVGLRQTKTTFRAAIG